MPYPTFRPEGLSEETARLLARADNRSDLIKYLLERYAQQRTKGGKADGQAVR